MPVANFTQASQYAVDLRQHPLCVVGYLSQLGEYRGVVVLVHEATGCPRLPAVSSRGVTVSGVGESTQAGRQRAV